MTTRKQWKFRAYSDRFPRERTVARSDEALISTSMKPVSSTTSRNKYVKRRREPFLTGEKIEDWGRERTAKAIQILHHKTTLNTMAAMRVSRRPTPDPVLSEFAGSPASRKFLYYAGCRFFGSWNSALKACGIPPIKTSYNKFWSKTLIAESIRRLHRDGHPLTVISIWRDRTRKTSRSLNEVTGRKTTGSSLHDAARRYFGSWDNALKHAGINSEDIKERPFWTKQKVVKSIQALHRRGVRLNTGRIGSDSSRSTSLIIRQAIGKKRFGRSLFGGAYRAFGSWDRALQESGIAPSSHRVNKFGWNIRQLARILNVLYELEIPINASSLRGDRSHQTNSVIYGCSGQIRTGSFLFHLGRKKLGTWDQTLKYAGFALSEIRRNGSPCDRDDEKIIQILRLIHQQDLALNRSAIMARSNQLKFFIETNFGPAVSGFSLISAAKDTFGSWDQALWGAGLDVSAIRLTSRPNSHCLPIVPHQIENVMRDGVFGRTKYLGSISKTPEQLLEEREQADMLALAVSGLKGEEKDVVDKIFDAILQVHHYRDQNQLIQFVAQHLGNEISEDQIRDVLAGLAERLTPLK